MSVEYEMNEPLEWKEIPSTGLGRVRTYRAKLDGKGWLVMMIKEGTKERRMSSPVFIPDPNNMWGR